MNSLTLLGGLDLGESSKESFAELKPPVYSLDLIFQNFEGKKNHMILYINLDVYIKFLGSCITRLRNI